MPPIQTLYIPEAAQVIADGILTESAHQPVLFLVSGGSATQVASHVIRMLEKHSLHFPITIAQIDERYGPVGHIDANWPTLLEQVGEMTQMATHPILEGTSREETVKSYEDFLRFHANDFIVGLLGVGLDGHTAGILPGSLAAQEQERWVIGYEGPDYNRITVTFPFLRELDWAVLYAQGAPKRTLLESLEDQREPLESPVHALKSLANITIIHTP